MSNEELVQLYQSGDKEALNKLVELNEGIVYKIANKFYVEKSNSIDIDDLIQEGFVGLILAADRYKIDIENSAKFITYAVYWIRQKISRFIYSKNTNDEVSLNTPVGEEDSSELMDYIEGVDYGFENVEEKLYLQQLRKELDQVMDDKLTLKEREIIKLHYGWDKNDIMTFSEIGEIFNVSKERIRQMESKAFLKIRHTTWGRLKGSAIYLQRKQKSRRSSLSVIDDITFAQRYLEVDI